MVCFKGTLDVIRLDVQIRDYGFGLGNVGYPGLYATQTPIAGCPSYSFFLFRRMERALHCNRKY